MFADDGKVKGKSRNPRVHGTVEKEQLLPAAAEPGRGVCEMVSVKGDSQRC